MVPDLQISKTVEYLVIYKLFLFFSELFYCFVMNEVFWRFGELSSIQGGSGTRDLQVVPELQISVEVDFLGFVCVLLFVRKQGGSAKTEISDFG